MIFTAVLLDYLKQIHQIFRVAIFQYVSEDLILSIDLNLFSLLFIWDLNIIITFCFLSKIQRFHTSCMVEVFSATGKD